MNNHNDRRIWISCTNIVKSILWWYIIAVACFDVLLTSCSWQNHLEGFFTLVQLIIGQAEGQMQHEALTLIWNLFSAKGATKNSMAKETTWKVYSLCMLSLHAFLHTDTSRRIGPWFSWECRWVFCMSKCTTSFSSAIKELSLTSPSLTYVSVTSLEMVELGFKESCSWFWFLKAAAAVHHCTRLVVITLLMKVSGSAPVL